MKELIKTRHDYCTGCNRCVRECPMETANITYQDENGDIKVTIDYDKCIACGRCVTACTHDARYFEDDTEQFFIDLTDGKPISIMTAPSIRTNIPGYKKLFTYLKNLGVKKIYDVSLGADLCIWGYVRYQQQSSGKPIITQPCPAIVSYILLHRHELLEYLAPVQSPMASLAVYMKEYEGISDSLAAFSPCIAKSNEFDETGLTDYNVTFEKLIQYLEMSGAVLPEEETDFDNYECGLGSLFPMPGGLKENIEFFTGRQLSIDEAEGFEVYDTLDAYAESDIALLPDIFDVLNCAEGCNIGTACVRSGNVFQINREMDVNRKHATEDRKREYYDDLYKQYDEKFELSHFLREYKPYVLETPEITNEDIEKAFVRLGKDTDEKQNINCGACGSETCLNMARKIALGVNIPINCIYKSMEDARKEHAENIAAHEQLSQLEREQEVADWVHTMFDATPLCAHFWDKDMKLVECNQQTVDFFQMPSKEEYIARYSELVPEYQPDGVRSDIKSAEWLEKALTSGRERFEWTRRMPDGELVPVEVTLVRVTFRGDVLLAGFTRDLREEKRMIADLKSATAKTEEALSEAESAFQALEAAQSTTTAVFEANPHINIMFDDHFNVIDCNPAAISFMNFKSKEDFLAGFIHGMTSSIPPFQSDGRPSLPLADRLLAAAKDGYSKFATEVVLGGAMRYLDVILQRIPYNDSFALVGYVIDTTEVHAREMALDNARRLNELQLTKLNLVVQASRIGLWDMDVVLSDLVNPDNEFIWSDEFRHMLGYSDAVDFPNRLGTWSDKLHPDDRERVLNALKAHILDKTGKTSFDVEFRLQNSSGEYSYLHASGETIRDDNGDAVHIAGSLVDISETKNLLLDTERQRVEAEAANQAKSAFLSTMSHEIRTPMNAILGITEIQLQNEKLDDNMREALGKIYASGDLLLGIINDILDLSKIEAGKLELVIDKYEIASLVSDTAQLNMMRIGSKPIEFELQADENMPVLMMGDELRVKQILNNLLSNAFKYTDEGTVRLSVSTEDSVNADETTLLIKVSDTGQGMTEEQVNKLFDEYSRFNMEANRTTEGTGLGMSITRNLIRLMKGDILIDSTPGEGSTFTVRIPQGRIGDETLGREMAENLNQFRTSTRAQMKRVQITREPMPYGKVLIVDDVETNIYVARGLLSPYGVKIESADSGFAAIEKIKSGKEYDIVFMDHMMPQMDGIEATQKIRAMGYSQPIVALTANAVTGQSEIFLGNGFDDFISKPIDVRQLNTILNKLIRDKASPEVIEEARRKAESPDGKEEGASQPPGIDPFFAEAFVRDAVKSLSVLDEIISKGGEFSEEDLRTYVIHVHGMKSALANVGNMALSAIALKLEDSGRSGNIKLIAAESQAFIDSLRLFVNELKPADDTPSVAEADEDSDLLHGKLAEIKTACEDFDESAADAVLSQLRDSPWSQRTGDLLAEISAHLLHSDFDEISEAIDRFLSQ